MILQEILDEKKLFNKEYLSLLLNEATSLIIPKNTKKLLSDKVIRENLLKTHGNEAYLSPSDMKYPIINPETGKPDCKLIYAARLKAKEKNEKDIYNKATELFKSNKCNQILDVKVEGHQKNYDLLELLDLIELEVI